LSSQAKIFYIVGASGSGKDSIIKEYRKHNFEEPVIIAHRYMTRENTAINQETENFISLSSSEYALRKEAGLFLLDWSANHCSYAIGSEVTEWITKGFSVIANGSREYLPEAKNKLSDQLVSINIQVSEDILIKRLESRGREAPDRIKKRIERNQSFERSMSYDKTINNDGDLNDAVFQLNQIIKNIE
jgi:ribose 1,5-bisphosphokinase